LAAVSLPVWVVVQAVIVSAKITDDQLINLILSVLFVVQTVIVSSLRARKSKMMD
jgi:hypothetical protein